MIRFLAPFALLAVLIVLAAVTRSAVLYYVGAGLFVAQLFAARPDRLDR